jgi:hypothetical protein
MYPYGLPVADPRAGSSGRVPIYADTQSGAIGYNPLDLARESGSMYTFGGGTIGGDIWQTRMPNYAERALGKRDPVVAIRPEFTYKPISDQDAFSGAAAARVVDVIPAGMGGRQEFWNSPEGKRIKQRGRWVEEPKKYVRGTGKSLTGKYGSPVTDPDSFYDPQTGKKFSGTLMGTGGYGGFGQKEDKKERDKPLPPRPSPRDRPSRDEPDTAPIKRDEYNPAGTYLQDQRGYGYSSRPMGFSGRPFTFTPAGGRFGQVPSPTATSTAPPFMETEPSASTYGVPSPFSIPDYTRLTGRRGGIPRFPYR